MWAVSNHQASSARDVALIAGKIVADHPNFYPLYSIRQFTFNNIKQDNRNMLLGRDPSVDGMKTGFTDAAGYCLVASAVRDMPNGKRRLLSVVMGTASREARASESQKLLNWGYTAWDAVRLFDGGKAAATVPVWKGAQPTAALGASQAIVVAVAGLIALSIVPVLAGSMRLVQLASGAAVTVDNARFVAAPWPVVLHVIGYLMCLREPRWLDLWIQKVSRCPRVKNYAHWRCNSYSP